MPGLDGTGPSGRGPMTGGARGRCSPEDASAPRYGAGSQNNAGTGLGARLPFFGRRRPRRGLRGLFGGHGFRGGRGRGRW
jgi:hypothetical protein